MAHTPYPLADETKENPSLLDSSDGTTWTTPTGVTNPIVAWPGGSGYNADTDLVHDGSIFYCFYGATDGTDKRIKVAWAADSDLATWTEVELFSSAAYATTNWVSPAVVKDGATWKMWLVKPTDSPNSLVYRTATDPLGPWSAESALSVVGMPSSRDIWHIDVFVDSGGTYRMIVNDSDPGVSGVGGTIRLGSSDDGLSWRIGDAVLIPDATGWDGSRLYRSTGFIEGTTLRLWYAGIDASNQWRIGYTTMPADLFPVAP